MMNERRSFLKGAGILGAFLGGVATPVIIREVEKKTEPVPVDMSMAPENPTTFTLMGNPKPVEQPTYSGNGFFITPSNLQYQNQVHLSVGKDDRLWIKVGEDWKRVSVDA
jgi:hypothetical protein